MLLAWFSLLRVQRPGRERRRESATRRRRRLCVGRTRKRLRDVATAYRSALRSPVPSSVIRDSFLCRPVVGVAYRRAPAPALDLVTAVRDTGVIGQILDVRLLSGLLFLLLLGRHRVLLMKYRPSCGCQPRRWVERPPRAAKRVDEGRPAK